MKNQLSVNSDSPIGIFDSGLGGLTVLKKIKELLPNENYIYFGDTAHLPYGSKSKKNIIEYSEEISHFLISKNVKAIVVACNSASSVAVNSLRKLFALPIFEVITPAVLEAAYSTKTNNICIIGTKTTIDSKIYSKKIKEINPQINTIEIKCPLFVPIIEEALHDTEIAYDVVKLYLNSLCHSKIDTLIMGCTHYTIIEHMLRKVLPDNISFISSGTPLAITIRDYFKTNKMYNNNKTPITQFFVSDSPNKFQKLASNYLDNSINYVENVEF